MTASQMDAAARADDLVRPDISQKGEKRMYFVGLVQDAPYDYINVPTVVLRGTIRGKCVEVPKRTGRLHDDGKGILVHTERAVDGRFEALYDIEVEGFLKYCDTHVFQRTQTYKVPEIGTDGKATGKSIERWRAEIQPSDPALQEGGRGLHEEERTRGNVISDYVWIVPAIIDRNGKPQQMGAQPTITQMRADKSFTLDKKPQKAANPQDGKPK